MPLLRHRLRWFHSGGGIVVKRVLLTGMSGTGKSTVIAELAARDYRAIDVDCDEFSEWVEVGDTPDMLLSPVETGRDWMWRVDRIQELLATEDAEVLFLGGCAENMRTFLPRFDLIILLSAPAEVIVERLGARTTNAYGKHPDEVARVLGLLENVEPLLRRAANYEIDTSAPLEQVVATVLQMAQSLADGDD
jgi:shikimate kinase